MNYNLVRRKTRTVRVGNFSIGGFSPIAIQSMTNTDTHNIDATVAQIKALENAKCDIVRITVPDLEAADIITELKKQVSIPVVADIHFDYKIAIKCAELGFDKIRINPGNIGDEAKIKMVCDACKKNNVPIRIGVNSGSLEKSILNKYGSPAAEALAESAIYNASLLEKYDFYDTVISIKSSDPKTMIDANRIVANSCDYPLHLGVTEAGSQKIGSLKSAIGIGALLCDGIGDTIRVSLTDDPVKEIEAAQNILKSIGVEGQSGLQIVSCPTCGRTKIDLINLVKKFEDVVSEAGLSSIPAKVAIMGCAVNGPGEAREADVGVAGGINEALLFKKGQIIRKIPESEIIQTLIEEIKNIKT